MAGHVLPGHVGLLVEPKHRGRGVFRHRENELRVVLAVPAHDRLKGEEFGRVEEVLFARGIVCGQLFLHDLLQFGRFLRAGGTIGVLRDDGAHGGRHVEELFGLGVDRGHIAFGTGRVAAQHRHLFENDHGSAPVDGGRGRDHARAAPAHDDHVGLGDKRFGGLRRGRLLRKEALVRTRLLERFFNAALQSVRRDGRPRHAVNARRLQFDHILGERVDRKRPDPGRFFVLRDTNVLDRVRIDRHFDRHLAVAGGNRRTVGARGHGGNGAARGCEGEGCGRRLGNRREAHHVELHENFSLKSDPEGRKRKNLGGESRPTEGAFSGWRNCKYC